MPVPCKWCETGTHSDIDKKEYPICQRKFLTKNEAWAVIGESTVKNKYHIFANPAIDVLVGADWSRKAIKNLIEKAESIELTERNGEARRMKHGLAIISNESGRRLFVETDEKALQAWEELYCDNVIAPQG